MCSSKIKFACLYPVPYNCIVHSTIRGFLREYECDTAFHFGQLFPASRRSFAGLTVHSYMVSVIAQASDSTECAQTPEHACALLKRNAPCRFLA